LNFEPQCGYPGWLHALLKPKAQPFNCIHAGYGTDSSRRPLNHEYLVVDLVPGHNFPSIKRLPDFCTNTKFFLARLPGPLSVQRYTFLPWSKLYCSKHAGLQLAVGLAMLIRNFTILVCGLRLLQSRQFCLWSSLRETNELDFAVPPVSVIICVSGMSQMSQNELTWLFFKASGRGRPRFNLARLRWWPHRSLASKVWASITSFPVAAHWGQGPWRGPGWPWTYWYCNVLKKRCVLAVGRDIKKHQIQFRVLYWFYNGGDHAGGCTKLGLNGRNMNRLTFEISDRAESLNSILFPHRLQWFLVLYNEGSALFCFAGLQHRKAETERPIFFFIIRITDW